MASVMYSEYTGGEGGEVQDRLLLKKVNFFFYHDSVCKYRLNIVPIVLHKM